jgi:hypothetical protein
MVPAEKITGLVGVGDCSLSCGGPFFRSTVSFKFSVGSSPSTTIAQDDGVSAYGERTFICAVLPRSWVRVRSQGITDRAPSPILPPSLWSVQPSQTAEVEPPRTTHLLLKRSCPMFPWPHVYSRFIAAPTRFQVYGRGMFELLRMGGVFLYPPSLQLRAMFEPNVASFSQFTSSTCRQKVQHPLPRGSRRTHANQTLAVDIGPPEPNFNVPSLCSQKSSPA